MAPMKEVTQLQLQAKDVMTLSISMQHLVETLGLEETSDAAVKAKVLSRLDRLEVIKLRDRLEHFLEVILQ